MIILIDSNEEATSPHTVQTIRNWYSSTKYADPVTVIVNKLQAGDINIPLKTGLLMIERKEAHDFLASIGDGRLFDQVERMQNLSSFCAVVVTGKFIYDHNDMVVIGGESTNWRGISVRGAITVVQWSGVPVLFCNAGEHFCKTIDELIMFANKDSHEQKLKKRRTITFPEIDPTVEKLAKILPDGMGVKMADSLLRAVCNDPTEDNPYGTILQAMEFVSLFGNEEEAGGNVELVRPAGWGIKSLMNTRYYWGLKKNQYISIETVGK